jgi:hypothetical protein
MNVLILTPDAVGSTLLQRLITVYMQFHEYDKPVINLHELTNGLINYYNTEFNRELLGKPPNREQWGYFQTLPEIVDLLEKVDHYKTSRLAQYHIRNRNDPLRDQVEFYKYLNDNFYIIACRRQNVLEHALGWAINKITKKLNVFTASDKLDAFIDLYKSKLEVDQEVLVSLLDQYKNYISWSEQYFSISSYFNYERDLPNIEKYILNLPVFASHPNRITWKDTYGIDFQDWNKCHYLSSDVGGLLLENKNNNNFKLEYMAQRKGNNVPIVQDSIISHLPDVQRNYLKDNEKAYTDAWKSTWKMVDLGIMVTGLPIKKQTFKEKQLMIKNFDQCVATYNDWALRNPDIAKPIDNESMKDDMDRERNVWTNSDNSKNLLSNQINKS